MQRIAGITALLTLTTIALGTQFITSQRTLAQDEPAAIHKIPNAQVQQTLEEPPLSVQDGLPAIDKIPDDRVRQALEKLQLNYELEADGRFRIELPLEGDRTQSAWISSSTIRLGSMKVRTITSLAYETEGMLSLAIANQLLQLNADIKFGTWQTSQTEDRTQAIFTTYIDANSSPDALKSALYEVLHTADQKELELMGSDRF